MLLWLSKRMLCEKIVGEEEKSEFKEVDTNNWKLFTD